MLRLASLKFASRFVRHTSSAARPFRVLGLQQVAIGGLDKAKLSALWEGVLGVPRAGEGRGAGGEAGRQRVGQTTLFLASGTRTIRPVCPVNGVVLAYFLTIVISISAHIIDVFYLLIFIIKYLVSFVNFDYSRFVFI